MARTEGFDTLARDLERIAAAAVTASMREASQGLKGELREQVLAAGMGQRLANTWQDTVYPVGRDSLSPAAWIESRAPKIIDAFSRGATIRPLAGRRYLWIPTDNVPRARARVGAGGQSRRGGAITPIECEDWFRTEFIIRQGKGSTLLAFMDLIAGRNGRGLRQRSRGRLAQDRKSQLTLMYVLRRSVRMPKRLDLEGPTQRWAAQVPLLSERRS